MILQNLLNHGDEVFLPNISVDIVIFGYEKRQLKVLLLQVSDEAWMLPGGYILRTESAGLASKRNLKERIGLSEVYLKQFYTFSDPKRVSADALRSLFNQFDISINKDSWIFDRFISVGHYALVPMESCHPSPGLFARDCAWFSVKKLPKLLFDHKAILMKAKQTLEEDAGTFPIPFHLLRSKFTMPELHAVFETLYDKRIDRSRFQKKMLSYEVFERLEVIDERVPHRRPYLYRLKEADE